MSQSNGSLNRFRVVTDIVLLVSLGGGVLSIFFDVKLALIPAALVFGWSQAGGL